MRKTYVHAGIWWTYLGTCRNSKNRIGVVYGKYIRHGRRRSKDLCGCFSCGIAGASFNGCKRIKRTYEILHERK
nr:MAG TPA: hypothetical protein [Caudoviricetes sp.]DAU54673.1 MAG TPA: hypothetical protein [Caudoviricetes sp.]